MYRNLLKHTSQPAVELEPLKPQGPLLELEGEAADLMAKIKTFVPNADVEGVLTPAIYDMEGFEGLMGTLDYTSAEDLRLILGKLQNVHEPIAQPAWRIGFHRDPLSGERLELREVWLDSREELINSADNYADYSRQLTHYSSEDLIPRRVESVELTELRQELLERRVVNLDEPRLLPAEEQERLLRDFDEHLAEEDRALLADDDDFAREVDNMLDEDDRANMARDADRPYELLAEEFEADMAAYEEVVELEPLLRPLLPFNVEGPQVAELAEGGLSAALEAPIMGAIGGAI